MSSLNEKRTGNQKDDGNLKGNEQDNEETPPRGTKRGRFEASPTLTLSLTEVERATEGTEQSKPANVSVISYLWDEDEKRSVVSPANPGRRRDSINPERIMREKAANLIRGVDKEMREMRKLISENQNTKKEIKQLASRLSSLVSQLSTKNLLDSLEELYDPREVIIINETKEQASQTQEEDTSESEDGDAPPRGEFSARLTRTIEENRRLRAQNAHLTNEVWRLRNNGEAQTTAATQTVKNAWQIRNEASAAKIREKLDNARDFEEIRETLTRSWPEEVFRSVRENEGNPLKDDIELNLGFWTGKNCKMDAGIHRQLVMKFPDLADLTEKEKKGEEPVCLEYESRRFSKDGYKNQKRRTVTSIRTGETVEETYEALMEWRGKLEEMEVRRVAIPVPESGWRDQKKVMEYAFRGSDIAVIAYLPQDKGRRKSTFPTEARPDTGREFPRRRNRTEEAVIVSTAGKPYAEALRQVKQSVNIDRIGIKIKNARSTRSGDLLLTVEKGGKGKEVLKEEIQRNLGDQGFQARIGKRDNMVLHVKGLEATSSIEEARAAIAGICGDADSKIRLGFLRPAFGGTQNLTVNTDRETGKKLVEAGRVRIGWATCNITERVEVRRCARCWKTGHLARECNSGVNRIGCCFKCAKPGHMVKDCSDEPFCPICNMEGHRADNTACPNYRSAMAELANRRGIRPRRGPTVRQDSTPTDSDMEAEPSASGKATMIPQPTSHDTSSMPTEAQTETYSSPGISCSTYEHQPND